MTCSPANIGPDGAALELGLVDAIGDLRATLRARFGDKVDTPLIGAERGLFGRRVPGVGRGEFMPGSALPRT